MLLNFLDELRGEPEPRRKRLAFIVAFCLTGVIGVAWFMSLSAVSESVQSYSSSEATSTSPLSAIASAFTDTANSVRDLVGQLKQSTLTFVASSTSLETSTSSQSE